MSTEVKQDTSKLDRIIKRFDEVLAQHLERLIGTAVGIGGLSLNVATLSCLFLIVERETDLESSQSSYHDRYERDTFLQELAELGLPISMDFSQILKEIIEKGYIARDSAGWLFANKSAIDQASLLDDAFGSISGINFIAYIVQRIDEVSDGRKNQKEALKQFEETLWMHGRDPLKQKPRKEVKPKEQKAKIAKKKRDASVQTKQLLQAYRERKRKEESRARAAAKPLSEPKPLYPIRDLSTGVSEDKGDKPGDQAPEISEEIPGGVQSTQAKVPDQTVPEISTKLESDEQALSREMEPGEPALAESPSDREEASLPPIKPVAEDTASEVDKAVEEETGSDRLDKARPTAEAVDETESAPEEAEPELTDAIIEERIAAFEETLSMPCPICNIGKVKSEQTAKQKLFYKCTNGSCIFISWGKPYHKACPVCNNPFLVEVMENEEAIILKCPRATCHYRQSMEDDVAYSDQGGVVAMAQQDSKANASPPKKRRRVVRKKRLVRRKR